MGLASPTDSPPDRAMKICSLLPSATEILFALGLGDSVVALTHECDYPPETSGIPVVTRSLLDDSNSTSRSIHNHISESLHEGSSIYLLDTDRLARSDPDLILTQELCDVCAVAYGQVSEAVSTLGRERRILSLEPQNLDGILDTIQSVAEQAEVPKRGRALIAGLRGRLDIVLRKTENVSPRPRVIGIEWLDPPFKGGHWVPQMIEIAGGEDMLGTRGSRSEEVQWDKVVACDPQVIVLMPCGFDVERTIEEFRAQSLPDGWDEIAAVRDEQIYAVNASAFFSRPGPRIVDGVEILAEILHPRIFPRESPPDAWSRHRTAFVGTD